MWSRYDIICSSDGRYEKLLQSRNLQMQSTSRNFRMQILRQLVSHPYNVYEEKSSSGSYITDESIIQKSSKLTLLDNLLKVLIPKGHRVLVFVQFVEVPLLPFFSLCRLCIYSKIIAHSVGMKTAPFMALHCKAIETKRSKTSSLERTFRSSF